MNRRAYIVRSLNYSTFEIKVVYHGRKVEETPLPRKISFLLPLACTSRHIVVALAEASAIRGKPLPLGSIVAYDVTDTLPADERLSVVYVPKSGEFNTKIFSGGLMAGKSTVHIILTNHGIERRLILRCENNT